MKSRAIMLGALAACLAQAQDVSLYSTTMAQMWKQDVPGFSTATYAPATQLLGIDADKLGSDALSLHIFGWGRADLKDQSDAAGKTTAYLSTAYMQYRFPTANAEIKAGRITVYNGVGVENVDGVAARADLVNGFAVSAFGGRPVWYKTADPVNQRDYEYQRNIIAGARLAWRDAKFGEIGLDYLQDGSNAAKDLNYKTTTDYSRRQVGFDVKIAPVAFFDLTGRTVQDVAKHFDILPGHPTPSKTAENDLTLNVRPIEKVVVSAGYIERNFFAYFAGTNLPSLFKQDERDQFKATYGSATWGSADDLSVTADFKHTERLTYGDTNRFGGEVRYGKDAFRTGLGYHRVNADKVKLVNYLYPSYSLDHSEFRAWVMYDKDKLSLSLDGILHYFNDKANIVLTNGVQNANPSQNIYEVVGSVGYQVTSGLKLSGDLSVGANPLAKKEVMGLLRAEYRFGMARKGGSK